MLRCRAGKVHFELSSAQVAADAEAVAVARCFEELQTRKLEVAFVERLDALL
jgi:hypothetical protein